MPDNPIVLASMRRYCMRWLTRATWRETYFPDPRAMPQALLLRETPLIAVKALTVDGAALAEGDDYRIDYHRARVDVSYYAWNWSEPGTLIIEYDAGYDPLPDDLQFILDTVGARMGDTTAGDLAGVSAVDLPDVGSVRFDSDAAGGGIDGAALIPPLSPYAATLSSYRDTSKLWLQHTNRRIELVPVGAP